MFNFTDKITFSKAIYYNFKPVHLEKNFKDATGGFGNYLPLQGWVKIYDDEGFCGEAFCSKGIINNILPLVMTGETKSYNEWYEYIYWKFRNFGFQSGEIVDLGQFDLIMLEILAKRANKSLHRFLGAKKDWAAAYKGGGSLKLDDNELVEDMVRYVEEGYTTIKFKVGSDFGKNLKRDARRMEQVRKSVGNNIQIAVDGNQVWEIEEALDFADMIRDYNPAWFEEPVHSQDMNSIKELKERGINMKIAFGESMRNYYAFETYAEKGVDHLMPLIGRMSRMDDLLKIKKLAQNKGLDFSSGGTTYINAVFGTLYNEQEMLEFHEPIVHPLGNYLEVKPKEQNGRFYLDNIVGSPVRLWIDKIESEGILESKKYYYADDMRKNFAVRAAY